MSYFRITDGKGFAMKFGSGWSISVQFGYGNYCNNYDGHGGDYDEDYRVRNRRLGESGCSNAEVAVFDPQGEMVTLPAFMFAEDDSADIVSGRARADKVLELMNWAATQPKDPS